MRVLPDKRSRIYVSVFAAITFIVLMYITQCGGRSRSVSEAKFRNIDSDELKAMMKDKDFTLINVHIPYAGEIPETDMFIPYTEIGEKVDLPKDSKIVLYCRSGPMSMTAMEKLVELGYTNILNLKNGMVEWQQKGNQLLSRPERQDN